MDVHRLRAPQTVTNSAPLLTAQTVTSTKCSGSGYSRLKSRSFVALCLSRILSLARSGHLSDFDIPWICFLVCRLLTSHIASSEATQCFHGGNTTTSGHLVLALNHSRTPIIPRGTLKHSPSNASQAPKRNQNKSGSTLGSLWLKSRSFDVPCHSRSLSRTRSGHLSNFDISRKNFFSARGESAVGFC